MFPEAEYFAHSSKYEINLIPIERSNTRKSTVFNKIYGS